jgi:Peptidase family M28
MQIKRISVVIFCLFTVRLFSQQLDTITEKNVKETLTFLASDELKGRGNYTKELLVAATFIGKKFREYGLFPFPGFKYYYQPFAPQAGEKIFIKDELKWNRKSLTSNSYINLKSSLISTKKSLKDYHLIKAGVKPPDSILVHHWEDTTNALIWIRRNIQPEDTLLTSNIILPTGIPDKNILIVAAPDEPLEMELIPDENFASNVLYNVVGILPGISKENEAIIFSAHYDHIGSGSEIYNGANDDASGTTAVLELARYFSMKNDNQRTIIFCLFAGEELGLLGSQAFVANINPQNIKTDINIEMIGINDRAGKNGFFITGSEHSSLKRILQKNLKGEKVQIASQWSDPKMLFQRSDNYTFYQKGIPAHSIMCSDDTDPCYHKACDDCKRIDFTNMTRIIKAIAKSCRTLISAEDTPR